MYWRFTETLGWSGNGEIAWLDVGFGAGLLLAEVYTWLVLVLGYFQTVWPLRRKPVPLPDDLASWPTVDIYIPTYNEPLKVVQPTVLAAMQLEWPQDKLRVYILDDGRRPEFKEFAEQVGAGYIVRPDNKHAKAGNINHALTKTDGEFIAIFDCDHVPARSFLQLTMGWFLRDRRLAMLQTPHHFFSPDPFERNLGVFRRTPNENELFYGLVQDGNDFWNATFFCGSCAVLRRQALDEIGGVAVETVTEDAHTALKMHRRGWNTAYINIPQAAGLATESLAAHIGQRIRWARGMTQVFRVDNPLLGRGLSLAQRLCYLNAMLHFLYGLPRLVFLTAPLAYLFLEAHVIHASALMIGAFALPHLAHAAITNSRLQGKYRHSFWAEVYEATLASYILLPTLLALINPKLGKFNVTAKGGYIERDYFDAKIAKPYLVLLGLNLIGLAVGIGRLLWWNTHEVPTVVMNLLWTIYNVIILGATVAIAWERRQMRASERIPVKVPASLMLADGRMLVAETTDISQGGVGVRLPREIPLQAGEAVCLVLFEDGREFDFPARVVDCRERTLGLMFDNLDLKRQTDLLRFTHLRADAWLDAREGKQPDRPLVAFANVFRYGVDGIRRLVPWLLSLPRHWLAGRREQAAKAAWAAMLGAALLGALGYHAPADAAQAVAADRTEKREVTLRQLSVDAPLRLRGVDGRIQLPFSVRSDEHIVSARLRLRYSHSPSLLANLSHLNVILNGEVIASIVLDPRQGGEQLERLINIPTLLISDYNELVLNFIGHYTTACEDPAHTSLWAAVSQDSVLELTTARLKLRDDLSLLPLPFFDPKDQQRVSVPFVFAGSPSLPTLKVAGTVASWLGALAGYRGAEFPVSIDGLPAGNAVLFAVGPVSLPGLDLPSVDGPTVAVMANPRDATRKLLVLRGRSVEELETAAHALVLGAGVLQGASARIERLELPEPRKPYDAPLWIPTDRPVRLGELASPDALQVEGFFPSPIRVSFRVPPDLFTWRSRGVPLELVYRYGTQGATADSTLNLSLNGKFVYGLPLPHDEPSWLQRQLGRDVFGPEDGLQRRKLLVPTHLIVGRDQMQFQYYFEPLKEGECRDVLLDSTRGAIDPNTTLDFSGFHHYTRLPDLAKFANLGFPFTRLADLADTAVVLPERRPLPLLEAYLALLGRLGEATGYPALRVTLVEPGNLATVADKDLLVITTASGMELPADWQEHMPLWQRAGRWEVRTPGYWERLARLLEDERAAAQRAQAARLVLDAGAGLNAVMGFISPLSDRRSVVLLTAGDVAALPRIVESIIDPATTIDFQGDLAVLRGTTVASFRVGPSSYYGELPWWTKARWLMHQHPLVLLVCVVLSLLLLAVVLYAMLKRRARKRLHGNGKKSD